MSTFNDKKHKPISVDKTQADSESQTAPPDPGSSEADGTAILEADLRKLQDERDSLFQQVARVQADFRNAQKRLENEKSQAIQFANSKLILGLLPVIDNFDRALEVDPAKADVPTLLKGMRMVHEQLMRMLQDQQVQVIAPTLGTPFDPNLHQALLQQPNDKYTEPTVTQLLQKGYAVHGRTLRPAQVAVSQTT